MYPSQIPACWTSSSASRDFVLMQVSPNRAVAPPRAPTCHEPRTDLLLLAFQVPCQQRGPILINLKRPPSARFSCTSANLACDQPLRMPPLLHEQAVDPGIPPSPRAHSAMPHVCHMSLLHPREQQVAAAGYRFSGGRDGASHVAHAAEFAAPP